MKVIPFLISAIMLFFSDKCQVYKTKACDFEDSKASILGEYIPSALSMDEGENALYMAVTKDYAGYMIFVFAGGKIAKVDMQAYKTLTNRKKLLKAYSAKDELAAIFYIKEDVDLLLTSSDGRMLIVSTGAVSAKTTKDTQGVAVMTLKKNKRIETVKIFTDGMLEKPHRYITRSLPAAGKLPLPEETRVLPGHGPESLIGRERALNPWLQG